MSRWLSPLMAFCLSFMIIVGLAPSLGLQIDRQIDFWLLWLGTMLILALPIVYLEIALAKRAKTSALNALSSLTRDADASQKWRVVGWVSVIFTAFLAGGVLFNVGQAAGFSAQIAVTSPVLFAVCAVIACVLSFVPRFILVLITAISVITSLILANVVGEHTPSWQMTSVEFKEWGNATILALVASGLGLGLYWQNNVLSDHSKESSTARSLPIWLAQIVAVIAFGYYAISTTLPAYTILIAAIASAALLLQLAKEQLSHRQVALPVQVVLLLLPLFVWAIPNLSMLLNPLLMLVGLVICLIYSIFVGWIMKISHLRKAMNLSNEVFYNIWRIAVRIVLPLGIVLAIISFIGQFV